MKQELKEIEKMGMIMRSYLREIYKKRIAESPYPLLLSTFFLLSIPFSFFISFFVLPYFGL